MIPYSSYRADGFALLPDFLPRSQVVQVLTDAHEVFRRQLVRHRLLPKSANPLQAIEAGMFRLFEEHPQDFISAGKQVQNLLSLHRLSLSERIESVLRELGFGFPNISTRPVLYFNHRDLAKKEVYWRVAAHQDWRSMQGSLNAIVVWVPLIDVDRELGALEIVPASHREGLLTDHVEDGFGMVQRYSDRDFVPLEMRQGDALFFSAFLVHRSGENKRSTIRWSCHFRYNDLDEPTFVGRGFPHPYLYKPQDELITPGFPLSDDVRRLFD